MSAVNVDTMFLFGKKKHKKVMSGTDSLSDVHLEAATCQFSSQFRKSSVMTTDKFHKDHDQESVKHEI